MMKLKTLVFLLTVAVLFSACSSSRHLQKTAQPSAVVENPQTVVVTHFVSDLDLDIAMGDDSYNLGGKLFMKKDKVVRMNLTFMGFIEVGTIEFTPAYILIVNRMGKEYTKIPYNSWDVLVKNNINFKNVEKMGWEKFYAGEGKKVTDSALDKAIENMLNGNLKGGKQIKVHIEVGKPNTEREFDTFTTVKSTYSEVPAQVLVSKLMSFAK